MLTTASGDEAQRAAAWFAERAGLTHQLRHERWGSSDSDSMTRLARLFPTLADADGIDPWDVDRFLRWACTADLTSGALHSVCFCLQVWSARCDWRKVAAEQGLNGAHLESFNLVQACGVWDEPHRAACLAWLEAPFFP
jgi:hypothetical protein